MSLKIQTSKPPASLRNAEVHLYLNPACTYQIVITRSWVEMLGQVSQSFLFMSVIGRAAQTLSSENSARAINDFCAVFMMGAIQASYPYRLGSRFM